MFGDLHIHMILDGVYYRAAIDAQKEHPLDGLVRARLSDYQARGVCPVSYTHQTHPTI